MTTSRGERGEAPDAAGRIAALAETLSACRWGRLDAARRRWSVALCALVLALKPGVRTHQVLGAAPYSADDLDLVDTLGTLANLGFGPRRESVVPARLDTRLLPCLVRPADSPEAPWIVLARTPTGGLKIYDAASEAMTAVSADDPRLARPSEAWFFKRFDENAQAVSRFLRAGSGHSWFRALVTRFSHILALVLAAGLILNLVALSIPLFIMLVYDNVIFSGATELLPGLAIGAALALVMEIALRHVRAKGLAWLAARLDYIVGVRIFGHLIELPPGDVERASVAAQIARIKTFEAVREFFCGGAFLSFLELPFIVLALGLIALVAGPLVLAPLAFVGGYILVFHLVRRRVKVTIRVAAKASTARQRFAMEMLEKLEAIRLNGLGDLWADKHRRLAGREGLEQFRLGQLGFVGETASHALTLLAGVTTVAAGAHLYWAGEITTGGMVASMILVWRVLAPLHHLCTMIPRLEQIRNSILQVNTLLDIDAEAAAPSSGKASFISVRGGLEFQDVRLRYDESQDPALDGLSFKADPGEIVAVTGASGAGKSSTLKLVKALHRPEQGAVLIDGFDIRQLDVFELRRQIAYAPQAPSFFTGSVLDNLRIANPLASRDDARRVLERLAAWDSIAALPDELDTRITGRGGDAPSPELAGRLSLARALLHDGRIMLVDELPNVLLSGPTGEAFKRFLAESKGKRTIVFVTQREDFIRLADKAVTLSRRSPPLVQDLHARPLAPRAVA